MLNLENLWNKITKLGTPAITTILGIIIAGLTTYFKIPLESQTAHESQQKADTSSTSVTGIEGGININNYPTQLSVTYPVGEPIPKKDLDSEERTPIEQKKLANKNVTQQIEDNNNNPTIINGSNNSVGNYNETNKIENIEKQINTERYIETEQYNENSGSGITNCVVDSGTCNENTTNNINSTI